MKKTITVWYVVIALTIWCITNSVARNNFVATLSDIKTQQQVMLQEVAHLMDRLRTLEEIEPEVIVKEVIKEVKVEVPVEVKNVLEGEGNVE